MSAQLSLTIYRNRTSVIRFTAYNNDGTVMDLTGLTLRFVAKRNESDIDRNAVIDKSSASGGITIASPATGIGLMKINPSDTLSLENNRSWVLPCDLVMFDSVDAPPLASGTLTVLQNIGTVHAS